MPNWTTNIIKCENPNVIHRFVNEKGDFDFNLAIKMPEELDIEDGTTTDYAIATYVTERFTIPPEQTKLSTLISNIFSDNWAKEVCERAKNWAGNREYNIEELYTKGKQYLDNKKKYGHYTWFGWCNQNWNTKWNACDTWFGDNFMTVGFNTAWDYPKPIFKRMCEMFPNERINFYSEFEEGGYIKGRNANGRFVVTEDKY